MIWFLALHFNIVFRVCNSSEYIYTLRSDQERLRKMQYSATLHRNRRTVCSIPTRGPYAAFFEVVPGQVLKCIYTHLKFYSLP